MFEAVRQENSATVDFPLVAGGREVTAFLKVLRPPQANPRPGQIEDIAILEIPENVELAENLVPLPRSSMPDTELNGREVQLYGFPADLARDHWAKAVLSRGAADGRVQFDQAPGSRPVVKGYSGAPVWDTAAECAVGMVVEINRDARGEVVAAYMIPASTLNRAVGEEERKPVSFPPNLAWNCDRDDEFRSFLDFLEKGRDQCDTRHPVFLLPGDGDANHEFFIRRLCHSRKVLRHFFSSGNGDPGPAHLLKVPWPDEIHPGYRLCGLLENLFHRLSFDSGTDFSEIPSPEAFVDACRNLGFAEYPAVMVVHRISWEVWDRHAPGILCEYLRDFWSRVPLENLPRFFIFLCLTMPKPGETGYRRWRWFRGWRTRRLIEKSLRCLEGEGVCLCHAFDELKPVRERHIHSWFEKRGIPYPEETEFRETMKTILGKRGAAPMAHVQVWLSEVIRAANETLSRPYLDENGVSPS